MTAKKSTNAKDEAQKEPTAPDGDDKVNSLNMGGGGDVVIPAKDEDESEEDSDLPTGADGKNPVSPNNPPKKALI